MSTFLNGFKINLSCETFQVYLQDCPNNQQFRALQSEIGNEWFLRWESGKIYGIPKLANPQKSFGQLVTLKCKDHLHLINSRILDLLPDIFSKYEPFKRKPFTFLAQKKELIDLIAKDFKNLPSIVNEFKIFPKYILEPKIFALCNDEVNIGLFLRLKTNWQVRASLSSIQQAGVVLEGLYVVRRQTVFGQRRLVGRIDRISKGVVYLSESFDNLESIAEDEVYLEGSKASFSHCLKEILGDRYKNFETKRAEQESQLLIGLAFDDTLNIMREFLVKQASLQIAQDLQGIIGERIQVVNTKDYQSLILAPDVEYCFDSARTKKSIYPWLGIDKYAPFSRDFFPKKTPEIAVFFPDIEQGKAEKFIRELRDGISIKSKQQDEYGNVDWKETSRYTGGFAKIFGLVNPKFTLFPIPLFKNTHKQPAVVYREEIERVLSNQETNPDVAIIILLDSHTRLLDPQNPYLHSKAILLMAGIPVQEVRLATISQPQRELQYTLQNLTLALYSKMNGLPWTVNHDLTINDELVIGIGTCELSGSRFTTRQRFVGITTVFRGDGNYLLGNLSKECSYDDYPNELKNSTLSILQEIKKRNDWQTGDTVRLVFHAARPFKHVNIARIIAECIEEVGSDQNIQFAFLTISHDHPFTILDKSQRGIPVNKNDPSSPRKGIYAAARGTIIQLGRYTRLLNTNSPVLIKRPNSPLPTPLLIHLHPQSTYYDLTYLSEQVLKFTSLSWKSLLPASDPVTIYYSELIAGLLARLKNIQGWSPTMLNIKLRASKWFL